MLPDLGWFDDDEGPPLVGELRDPVRVARAGDRPLLAGAPYRYTPVAFYLRGFDGCGPAKFTDQNCLALLLGLLLSLFFSAPPLLCGLLFLFALLFCFILPVPLLFLGFLFLISFSFVVTLCAPLCLDSCFLGGHLPFLALSPFPFPLNSSSSLPLTSSTSSEDSLFSLSFSFSSSFSSLNNEMIGVEEQCETK